jgi:hypothetical protein
MLNVSNIKFVQYKTVKVVTQNYITEILFSHARCRRPMLAQGHAISVSDFRWRRSTLLYGKFRIGQIGLSSFCQNLTFFLLNRRITTHKRLTLTLNHSAIFPHLLLMSPTILTINNHYDIRGSHDTECEDDYTFDVVHLSCKSVIHTDLLPTSCTMLCIYIIQNSYTFRPYSGRYKFGRRLQRTWQLVIDKRQAIYIHIHNIITIQ